MVEVENRKKKLNLKLLSTYKNIFKLRLNDGFICYIKLKNCTSL